MMQAAPELAQRTPCTAAEGAAAMQAAEEPIRRKTLERAAALGCVAVERRMEPPSPAAEGAAQVCCSTLVIFFIAPLM